MTVEPKSSEKFSIIKDKANDKNYLLENLPKGQEIGNQFMVNNIANSFAKLNFTDVTATEKNTFSESELIFSSNLEAQDGLLVQLKVAKSGDKYLAKLSAEFNEALVTLPVPEPTAAPVDPNPAAAATEPPAKDAEAAKLKAEEAKQKAELDLKMKQADRQKQIDQAKSQAKEYNDLWSKWVFTLADTSATNIGKKKNELYKQVVKDDKTKKPLTPPPPSVTR